MCDWILENMPWCVEHIGRLPYVWQIVLALGIILALTLGYCLLQNALSVGYVPRRAKTAAHTAPRYRVNYFSDSDRRDIALDWVDPEKVEVWR